MGYDQNHANMLTSNRRYDIDWIRVIAIGLLLIYHIAIGFQSWGILFGFITNKKSWESLWVPMSMLNVWRIPLLFFVSGMGVCFSLQNRNWKQLIQERAARILLPFVIGIFLIVPLHTFLWQYNYSFEINYNPHPGHLWFLGNIFSYVVLLSPLLIFLKKHEDGAVVRWTNTIFSTPLGLVFVITASVAEVVLVDPNPYEMYAMTWHGFFLGLLAFLSGFFFVSSGSAFWNMMLKWRWVFLAASVSLYIYRFLQFQMRVPGFQLAIESDLWIFSVLSFAYKYLNRPSSALRYLSQAAYPVYILHMLFLYLGSLVVFRFDISVYVQFILVLIITGVGCFGAYEGIRRVRILRPLFGLSGEI